MDPRNTDVQSLFDQVASRYDLMNRFMTFGRDRWWRRFLIARLELQEGMAILDAATGTGDLIADAVASTPRLNPTGIDFSANMIRLAQERFRGSSVKLLQGDAKIGLSSSLNLDLTVNPDFSQVEVDEQVTNLDRFEIYYPEKRQFFLENNDLFSEFGVRQARPFFSCSPQ